MTDFQNKNGYVIDKGNDKSFKGLTDAIPEYFYLDFKEGDGQIEFDKQLDSGKGIYLATGNFKLVCRTTKYDVGQLSDALFSCLNMYGEANRYTVSVEELTTDEEYIFTVERPDMEIPKDMCLIWIGFSIEAYMKPNKNCITLECKDKSC
jgi:hypothetical protein